MKKFEEDLKQMLSFYEQFEDYFKSPEETFMTKTEQMIKDIDEHSNSIEKTKDEILKSVKTNQYRQGQKINKCGDKIQKVFVEEKEERKTTIPRFQTEIDSSGMYEKKLEPFPNYASKHHYETRLSEASVRRNDEKENESNEDSMNEVKVTNRKELKKGKKEGPNFKAQNKKEEKAKRWKY